MASHIRRRKYLATLGGAATWPLAAHAQEAAKLPTIGFLVAGTPSSHGQWVAALVQRLRELGWIEGRTVAIEYRWAEGRTERYTEIAAEFVQRKVDVIVTSGPAVLSAKQATSVIPIVFAVANDPVGTGMVASLARPGGNVTGLSIQNTETAGKESNSCASLYPNSDGWRSWPMLAIQALCWRWARFRQPPKRLASKSSYRNSASGGYRAWVRGAQRPRGGALCLWRPGRPYPPHSHQRLGARRATADNVRSAGEHRGGRSRVLWSKFPGPIPALR
jgi:hypothetical protein